MRNALNLFWQLLILAGMSSCASSSGDKKTEVVFEPTEVMFQQKYNFYDKAEELRYNVKLGIATGGEIVVKTDTLVKNVLSVPCYHTKMTVSAKGAVNWFTNFHDVFESFSDTLTRLPLLFKRNIVEGGYKKIEETHFNRSELKANVSDLTDANKKEVKSYTISANIHDAISSYFVFRSIPFEDLQVGDTLKMDVFMEDKPYNFDILILGQETVKFENKKVNCWVISPYMAGSDLFTGENGMKAWISDDKRRAPLKFQAKLPIGTVEAKLKSYKAFR